MRRANDGSPRLVTAEGVLYPTNRRIDIGHIGNPNELRHQDHEEDPSDAAFLVDYLPPPLLFATGVDFRHGEIIIAMVDPFPLSRGIAC